MKKENITENPINNALKICKDINNTLKVCKGHVNPTKIEDILKEGYFGLSLSPSKIYNFPYNELNLENRLSFYNATVKPFVVVNKKVLYQDGAVTEFECLSYLIQPNKENRSEAYKHLNKVIAFVWKDLYSFTNIQNKLFNFISYDKDNEIKNYDSSLIYCNPDIPPQLNLEDITKIIGNFVLVD